MGDDSSSNALAKKRAASEQISKDNDCCLDNEWQGLGSFEKASEEVLASRHMLSVHRKNAVDVSIDEEERASIVPSHVKDLGVKTNATVDGLVEENDAIVEDLGEEGGVSVEDLGEKDSVSVEDLGSNVRFLEDESNDNVEDLVEKTNANVEDVGEKAYAKLDDLADKYNVDVAVDRNEKSEGEKPSEALSIDTMSHVTDKREETDANVGNLGEKADAKLDDLGEKGNADVLAHRTEQSEDGGPSEALHIDARSHVMDQEEGTDANVVNSNEQHEVSMHVGTLNIVPCFVKDGEGRGGEASEDSHLKDSHLKCDSVSEDKHIGSNEGNKNIMVTDDGCVKDAKQCEPSTLVSANNVSTISIPPLGANFCSSTFSFGTAPLSFATPTGFASFRNSSQTFATTENATSGVNSGSMFSFNFSDESTLENDNSSGFQLSFSQKSESLAPSSGSFKLQEVSLHTGEEQETAIFSSDASLFEFVSNAWKQRGKGELKINVLEGSKNKARMLMRMKGNYKLLLNANLFPDMKVTSMESQGVTFACFNSAAEGRNGLTTYAVKFRDSMIATNFQDIVNSHKGGSYLGLKTPENSP